MPGNLVGLAGPHNLLNLMGASLPVRTLGNQSCQEDLVPENQATRLRSSNRTYLKWLEFIFTGGQAACQFGDARTEPRHVVSFCEDLTPMPGRSVHRPSGIPKGSLAHLARR